MVVRCCTGSFKGWGLEFRASEHANSAKNNIVHKATRQLLSKRACLAWDPSR
jgi:hypothetical protein